MAEDDKYIDFDETTKVETKKKLQKPSLYKVLLLNDDKTTEIGSPSISGASVEAKLIDNVKDRTVLIFHKRRRKHSRKKNGHRQRHSKIQITKISTKDGKVIDEAKAVVAKKAGEKEIASKKTITKEKVAKKKVVKK